MYKIYLLDSQYGHILNSEGRKVATKDTEYFPEFETLKEAEKEKDRILEKYVFGMVQITNMEDDTFTYHINEKKGPLYDKEVEKYSKWINSLWRKYIFKKPKLKYYKPEEEIIREQEFKT